MIDPGAFDIDYGSEHAMQVEFTRWLKDLETVYPELKEAAFAVPNGGKRPKVQDEKGQWFSPVAKKLKAEGEKAGVADYFILIPRGAFCGLVIEFKYKDNKPTPKQEAFLNAMMDLGYFATALWSLREAQDTVLWYLQMERQ